MTAKADSRQAGGRFDHATVIIFLAVQSCCGVVLGGLWLYLMMADAEDQGYQAVDYVAPAVVLTLGLALGGCALLEAFGAPFGAAPVVLTQMIAMAVGLYSVLLGAQVGLPILLVGFAVLVKIYQRSKVSE